MPLCGRSVAATVTANVEGRPSAVGKGAKGKGSFIVTK
jgi:hypothetical protein